MKKPPIQILLQFLARFSPATAFCVARVAAFFVYLLPNQIKHFTRLNISACFTDRSAEEARNLQKKSIVHSCLAFVELSFLWCKPTDDSLALTIDTEITSEFESKSRGQLIIAPHLGSWEFLNLWLANRGPLLSLYKPQKNPQTDQFILEARSQNGAQLVATGTAGLRQVMKGLKLGKSVMVLPDQKPRRYKFHLTSDFFGQPARTSGLVHSLCDRVDCDVYIATALRETKKPGYRIKIDKLDHALLADSPQASVDYLNQSIEKLVAFSPEQYQWGYPRFGKTVYGQVDDQ